MTRTYGKVKAAPMPKTDTDWQAKDDAYTLTQAAAIMDDEKRFKAAKKWVSIQVIEAQEILKMATKVEAKLEKKA